jgi:23S rRNA (guanosine2251-2'-O)-methyltransferase
VPVAVHAEPAATAERFRAAPAQEVRWIGLEAHAGALPLAELGPRGSAETIVLALGAEGPGLSAPTRAQLHASVTIPLAGRLESLNVTVAAALVLSRLAPQLTPP